MESANTAQRVTSHQPAVSARVGWASVLAAATLWGTTGLVFQALATSAGADAASIGFMRLAMSVPIFLVVARLHGGMWLAPLSGKGMRVLVVLGLSMAFYQLTYVWAIERVGVAISVLISICLSPIFVALIAVLWLRERFHAKTCVALVAAIAGTVLLVGLPSDLDTDLYRFWMGVLIAVACALCQALFVLSARAAGNVCTPTYAAGVGFAIGALALLPFMPKDGLQLSYSLAGWGMLLYVAVIPTAVAQTLFLSGIKETGAVGGAIASLLEPLVATVLAVIVLNERMSAYGVLGAVILLGSIVIIQWTPKRDRRVKMKSSRGVRR